MAAPYSLEDTLRRHDEAFSNWLQGLSVDYGNISGSDKTHHPILQVMASPKRAYARVVQQLVSQGWIVGADLIAKLENANDFAVLPLPVASWERVDDFTHFDHAGVPKRFNRGRFLAATQEWQEHPWPATYQTEYRLNFWSHKRYTMNYLVEWVMSQLGPIGAGESEVFLPVVHADPWGTHLQALKYDTAASLSDLEGEGQRYLRKEYSFRFSVKHFRLPTSTSGPICVVQPQYALLADGVDADDLTAIDFAPLSESGNLFSLFTEPKLFSSEWPKSGTNATVAHSVLTPTDNRNDPTALKIGVTASTDVVEVASKPVWLDGSSRALLSVSFQYQSDEATQLEVWQRDGTQDPPVWTSVKLLPLPAQSDWTRVHFFTVLTQPIFDITLVGAGSAAVVRLAQIRVRHLFEGTTIAPGAPVVGGSTTTYEWTGLTDDPHLVVVAFTASGASGTLQLDDDSSSPSASRTETFDDSQQLGAALLSQPLTSTLLLTVPNGLSIAAVYAQRYDGAYAGHEL